METSIRKFVEYIVEEKGVSYNTQISYERDLKKLITYLREQGIENFSEVSDTSLGTFVLLLEKEGKAAATVSRYIASLKSFFEYCYKKGIVETDPAERLKPPRVEKKFPQILTIQETKRLIDEPDLNTDKGVRDRAMIELLYATGIRVSELLALRLEDINLSMEYIICHEKARERIIPFGSAAKDAMTNYLNNSRVHLLGGNQSEYLFVNCSGKSMSRQGFWKLIKYYAEKVGIEKEITPHTFRHSFAAHLLEKGADIHSIQKLMGHTDISAAQRYTEMNEANVREVYKKFHPRS